MFLIYVLFLIASGIAMLVMAGATSGQTVGRRVWYAVFGAGFTLYGLYLLLFFRGGHYLFFFYVFILPVLMTVRFFRDRSAFRAKQQAAALQGPPPGDAQPPGYGEPPGYAQPPGGGDIQDAAAAAAQTAGYIGAPPWAAGTPLPAEMTGGFPLPADLTGAEPSPRHRRTAVLTAVAVSVVATVAATAIVLGKTTAHHPTVTPAPTPAAARTPTPERALTIGQLRAGDCLQGPPGINTALQWPAIATAVPCSDKHLAQVYFFSASYWPTAMAFPGRATIDHQAKKKCHKAFQAYDGAPLPASQFSFRWIHPWDRAQWDSGDRLLLCTAYVWDSQDPHGVPLYTSIKGSYT